jgi:branched-chain amino acid transport system ATP-binding protein
VGQCARALHGYSRCSSCRFRSVRAAGTRWIRARSASTMLELRDVSKRYGGVRALDGVTFAVRTGEIVGLMGANGAGKTTLFEVIAGNARPTEGDILMEGSSLVGLRPDQVARRGIARAFQIVKPFYGLTVFENAQVAALFGAKALSINTATSAANEALEAVGLAGRAGSLASDLTLSGQKRLEIARTVAAGARLLLIDEVMAGLTPKEVVEMLDILERLRRQKGLTIVVIEHVMRALMQLSDRVVVLHLGKCIAQGTPKEIAANEQVAEIYFGRDGDDA